MATQNKETIMKPKTLPIEHQILNKSESKIQSTVYLITKKLYVPHIKRLFENSKETRRKKIIHNNMISNNNNVEGYCINNAPEIQIEILQENSWYGKHTGCIYNN